VNHYLAILGATLEATGPIFCLIVLGIVLKRLRVVDDTFVAASSRLVFTVCLPVLLFTTIVKIDLERSLDVRLLGFALAATVLAFLLSWVVAAVWVRPRVDRGVVTQGAFRGNLAVIGIALCASAYGEPGLAIASLLMAAITVLYNVLSVIVLSWYLGEGALSWRTVARGIVMNPLIIAIVLALCVAALRVPLPGVALSTGTYLGSMALPLAVLGSGAGLSLRVLRDSSSATVVCLVLKLALLPLLSTALGWWAGYRGVELGVIFLLFASPTAAASFSMVQSLGGNARLAANLIMTTTLCSVVTTSLGLFVLKAVGLG
jgi:hypothetical protein